MMTCFRLLIRRENRIMHTLKNLEQFIEVIDIFFKFRLYIAGRSLNINLHDEPRLTVSVDLALTTITCIVDHLLSARMEVSRDVTGNKPSLDK